MCQSLFFNKVYKKEALAQVFSCERCKISKNTFFTELLLENASDYFYSNFVQILGRSEIYANESVNQQSGLVVYLPTTIIFNLNHEMKHGGNKSEHAREKER